MLDIIDTVAYNNRFHPVREIFNRLEWDGVPRLDTWLQTYCGASLQSPEYLAAVGSNWIKAGVKRIMEPGTPFHHMLILEGGQGSGKTTFLKQLCIFEDQDFSSDNLTFDVVNDKYGALMLQGKLIIEFGELSKMGTATDRS